jgi:hypothetical protein
MLNGPPSLAPTMSVRVIWPRSASGCFQLFDHRTPELAIRRRLEMS